MGRLLALAELGRSALMGFEPGVMVEAVALVRRELGLDRCDLLSFSADGSTHFVAICDDGGGRPSDERVDLPDDSPAAQVLRTQLPVMVEDLAREERLAPPPAHEAGVVSTLNVPLVAPDRPLGVLGAHMRTRRRFSVDEVAFLQVAANLLSGVLLCGEHASRSRQKSMQRAEQMMAIGQVAAGVAHELRNPLTSIKGLVQVNLREAAERGVPADDLSVIEHEIRRMERTLQTFLDFARPPKPERRALDLQAVVDRVFSLISGRARKQNVVLRAIGEPIAVAGDQDQLQQLLLNLLLNALDAMPDGGTIEVETAVRAGYAEVIVRDSGPGIAADVLPKVFETFVSSKETGVGLGLPVSLRIAEDHGGTLNAYNLPGGGACFVLRLPAQPDSSPE